jgi:hypothetical protein
MRKILRPKVVFDTTNGLIPIGATKADEDYILHSEDDPWIAGIPGKVRRVRLVNLGERAMGLLSDDVQRAIDEIATLPYVKAYSAPYEQRKPKKKRKQGEGEATRPERE